MALTEQEIIEQTKEYFSSDLAAVPATIEKSYSDEVVSDYELVCVYRTEDGRGCAVGHLLNKVGIYDSRWDSSSGTNVGSLPEEPLEYLGEENLDLLCRLQSEHDALAREHELSYWGFEDNFGDRFLEVLRAKFPSKFATV